MCFAEGEEFVQLRSGLGRIANEQRLSLPLKPKVFVKAGLIEIVIDFLRRLTGLRIHHEADLGSASAFLPDFAPNRTESEIDIAVSDAICGVEDHGIDTGIGEEMGMTAQHPRVARIVIAVERLAPVVGAA